MENGPPPIKRLHETQVFKKSMVKALKNGGQVVLLDLGNLKVQIEETETKHPSLITQVLQQYHSVLAASSLVSIEKFKEDIESKGLQDQVVVIACSHVGGHKYAGNVIIFSADAEGKISGNW